MNAVEGIGGDAAAVAQPRRQLAVVNGTPTEGGFGKTGTPAIIRNFLEQLLCVHGSSPARTPALGSFLTRAWSLRLVVGAILAVTNQAGGLRSTTILPTSVVGRIVGWVIFPGESLTGGFGGPAGPHAKTPLTFLRGPAWRLV